MEAIEIQNDEPADVTAANARGRAALLELHGELVRAGLVIQKLVGPNPMFLTLSARLPNDGGLVGRARSYVDVTVPVLEVDLLEQGKPARTYRESEGKFAIGKARAAFLGRAGEMMLADQKERDETAAGAKNEEAFLNAIKDLSIHVNAKLCGLEYGFEATHEGIRVEHQIKATLAPEAAASVFCALALAGLLIPTPPETPPEFYAADDGDASE